MFQTFVVPLSGNDFYGESNVFLTCYIEYDPCCYGNCNYLGMNGTGYCCYYANCNQLSTGTGTSVTSVRLTFQAVWWFLVAAVPSLIGALQ